MWLLLACLSDLSEPPLSGPDILAVLRPEGWAGGCGQVHSVGVDTTACTLRRGSEVAVVTAFVYERADDAARAWAGADAVGVRSGPHVIQVDVFDEEAARSLLTLDPDGLLAAGFVCEAQRCQRSEGERRALIAPATSRRAPGYEEGEGRVAAVLDRDAARVLLGRLSRSTAP